MVSFQQAVNTQFSWLKHEVIICFLLSVTSLLHAATSPPRYTESAEAFNPDNLFAL